MEGRVGGVTGSLAVCSQLSVGIIPTLVIICWILGIPLSLDFRLFEIVVLLMSALVVNSVVGQAESTYLEGVLLVASYIIIAVAFKYRSTNPDFASMQPACDDVCFVNHTNLSSI